MMLKYQHFLINYYKNKSFKLTFECDKSMTNIKQAFATTVTLDHFNFKSPFIIDTDASDYDINEILLQKNEQNN